MDDLPGKACLVTGASTGIGAAVARALAEHGASVAVHYHRSAEQAQRVAADVGASGSRAIVLQGDVGDPAVAGRLVAEAAGAFERLDILINNAGGPLGRCAARHGGGPGALVYAAAKAAVSTLTRGLAKELAPHGIRVNAVSRGVVLTPIHERLSPPAVMDAFIRSVPLGRAAASDECVGAFLFLASERLSSYVTGQILEVNGGQLMP